MNIPETSSSSVQDSLLAVCLFAAYCDGEKSDTERQETRRLAEEIGSANLQSLSRQILMGKLPVESVIAGLATREDRLLAYEMALAVCEAGDSVTPHEKDFLADLSKKLGLSTAESLVVNEEVTAISRLPIEAPAAALATIPAAAPTTGNDQMILKYAILIGALEFLPEALATVAILPLQMKMVYRIGKSHGVELGSASVKEFFATAGLGLGSQMLEGFARKLTRSVGKKMAGKLAGRVADQVTGSALSFATTFAIGHVAEKYYSSGRKLDSGNLKTLFASLKTQAQEVHTKYLPEMQERAKTITPSSLFSLIRGGGTA